MKKNKSSKSWLIDKHRDLYFKQSKTLGYRSRSAFKLIEINKKFNFLRKNTSLVDLGSSPGGWSQVASKIITNGKILSIDIKDMEKINNVYFIKGDFLNNENNKKIIQFFHAKVDVVLSDMAANTSGSKSLDSYRTGQLSLEAMELSTKILSINGIFISKIFMGSIFEEIQINAKKYFKKFVKFKPKSSKKESKEIYIYCKGLREIWKK